MTPTPVPHRPSLARRALPALVLTGASVTFLHALDRPPAADATDASGASGATGATTATSSAMPSTAQTPPPSTALPTTGLPATAPTATALTCTTVDGPAVSTRWGTVQVEAQVAADGTLCAVDAIQTPNDRQKSVSINERAVPILDANALAAQGTDFDGVSGATVTSNGYRQSLQALLDGLA